MKRKNRSHRKEARKRRVEERARLNALSEASKMQALREQYERELFILTYISEPLTCQDKREAIRMRQFLAG